MKLTVEELRQMGFKVRVTHKRMFKLDKKTRVLHNIHDVRNGEVNFIDMNDLLPHGGETSVEVTTPDGDELKSSVTCYAKIPYNKKLGVKIALGRALYGHKEEKE